MTDRAATPTAPLRRSLAALELAALHHRGRVRQRLNVSDEELAALLYLAYHGGIAQRRLAEFTTLSRSGAGAMIQRLEQDGFVQRRTDRDDRRLRFVELAPAGRERIDAAYRELIGATEQLLADRPGAELDALRELVDGLAGAALGAHGADATDQPGPDAGGDPIWRRWA